MSVEAKLAAVPDVDIDVGKFKYIQIRVSTPSGSEKIIIRGDSSAEYHADIYDPVSKGIEALGLDTEPIGGGRIFHNVAAKTIEVYGYSMGFGPADHSITVEKLKKVYPDYTISFSNEGY